ncbi:uncharacterized protein [Littorina saxatilis]|uniref:uncharacterized protein isoform X2 n=1 Tax=Littorina saxatilis TaxID=31220 RepID=UPI0038B584D1
MLVLVRRKGDRASILSLVVIRVAATMLTAASQQVCQHVAEAGGLKFADQYPAQPVVETAGAYSNLSCCTGRQSNVNHTWYKWINNTWCLQTAKSECDYNTAWNYRHTSEDGQTLEFQESDAITDSGIYLCSATDEKSTINRTFTLLVVGCETNIANITFSTPSDAQTSVGKDFSQVCQGDFGCHGAVDSSTEAWWSYLDEHGNLHDLSQGSQGHYRIQESISQDETKKTARLIIRGVKEGDFHRVFICSLHMKDLPLAGFNLTLSKIETDERWQRYIPLIVVPSVLFGVILVTVLLTWKICGSLVAFKWRSVRDTLPGRGPGHLYDAMLLAGDDDEEGEEEGRVMRMLSSTLHQKGYKIYTPQLGLCMSN